MNCRKKRNIKEFLAISSVVIFTFFLVLFYVRDVVAALVIVGFATMFGLPGYALVFETRAMDEWMQDCKDQRDKIRSSRD